MTHSAAFCYAPMQGVEMASDILKLTLSAYPRLLSPVTVKQLQRRGLLLLVSLFEGRTVQLVFWWQCVRLGVVSHLCTILAGLVGA